MSCPDAGRELDPANREDGQVNKSLSNNFPPFGGPRRDLRQAYLTVEAFPFGMMYLLS